MRTSILVIALLCTSAAEAQTHPPSAVANEAKHAAWLELGFASESVDLLDGAAADLDVSATVLMFTLGGAFRVHDLVEVGGSLPFMFNDASAEGTFGVPPFETMVSEESAGFLAGNPFFRGSVLIETPRARLRGGIGVALPLAPSEEDDDDDEDEDVHISTGPLAAVAAHGAYDAWLWLPDRTSLVFPFRADGDSGNIVWAGELAVGMLFDADDDDPMGAADDPDETETFFQTAGEIGFRIDREMVVGGRFQLWWHTSTADEQDAAEDRDDDYDDVQTAIEPFFRLYGEDWFGSARFLIDLDEPFGIFGDGWGVWALYVTAGWRQE